MSIPDRVPDRDLSLPPRTSEPSPAQGGKAAASSADSQATQKTGGIMGTLRHLFGRDTKTAKSDLKERATHPLEGSTKASGAPKRISQRILIEKLEQARKSLRSAENALKSAQSRRSPPNTGISLSVRDKEEASINSLQKKVKAAQEELTRLEADEDIARENILTIDGYLQAIEDLRATSSSDKMLGSILDATRAARTKYEVAKNALDALLLRYEGEELLGELEQEKEHAEAAQTSALQEYDSAVKLRGSGKEVSATDPLGSLTSVIGKVRKVLEASHALKDVSFRLETARKFLHNFIEKRTKDLSDATLHNQALMQKLQDVSLEDFEKYERSASDAFELDQARLGRALKLFKQNKPQEFQKIVYSNLSYNLSEAFDETLGHEHLLSKPIITAKEVQDTIIACSNALRGESGDAAQALSHKVVALLTGAFNGLLLDRVEGDDVVSRLEKGWANFEHAYAECQKAYDDFLKSKSGAEKESKLREPSGILTDVTPSDSVSMHKEAASKGDKVQRRAELMAEMRRAIDTLEIDILGIESDVSAPVTLQDKLRTNLDLLGQEDINSPTYDQVFKECIETFKEYQERVGENL